MIDIGDTAKNILLTGSAGFIGFHLAQRLCADGHHVTGIDVMNEYYDVSLKQARNDLLNKHECYHFKQIDLADQNAVSTVFNDCKPDIVIHLAAQAGVRYSLENPRAYIDSNIHGFMNILEGCRHHDIQHLIYASSSSVYGANTKIPFSVSDNVDHPISLYAATKKSNELMAHSYAHLYGLPVTGLRFFTVYGPWGRPDMAYFKFTKALYEGKPIDIYNNGDMRRDFTYIDDITEALIRLIPVVPSGNDSWSGDAPDPASSKAPYRLYNIGNSAPENLMDFITTLEQETGITAQKNFLPMQAGDVYETYADSSALEQAIGFTPRTPLHAGLQNFVRWYKDYYALSADKSQIKAG